MTAEQIDPTFHPAVPAAAPAVESTVVTAFRVRRTLARLVLGDSCDGLSPDDPPRAA